MWPCSIGTSGHEGWSVPCAFFTTRNSRSNKEEAFGLHLMTSSDSIWVMRITSINDDVSLFKIRLDLSDEIVDGRTGFDKKDDSSRLLQLAAELLDRVSADDVGASKSVLRL
jgi:hypothetical protein